jgi:hypothetical protein
MSESPLIRRLADLLTAPTIAGQSLAAIDAQLVDAADRHWVAPLLAHRVTQASGYSVVAPDVAAELRHQLCFEAAFELTLAEEIRSILAACAGRGVPVLLMKGAALAHTHYPAPHLRPRLDTDLLIPPEGRAAATAALLSLGYAELPAVSGAVTVQQGQFCRALGGGLRHAVDLHWKLVNPVVFADLLSVDEMLRDSVPVPALSPHARALCPVHALLALIIHRVAHHEPQLDLLALYDLFAVASRLTDVEWRRLRPMAEERGLAELTARGVARATGMFVMPLPTDVEAWIQRNAARPIPEVFAPFMGEGRRVIDVIAADLRSSGTWRARARIVREHLLPPVGYMRARYGNHPAWQLPYFYVRRVVAGLPNVLRRGRYR